MILQAPKRVRTEEYGPEQRIDGWGLGSPQQKARSASAHPLAYPYLTRDGGIILTTVLREATNQISSTLSDEATSEHLEHLDLCTSTCLGCVYVLWGKLVSQVVV